MCLQEHLFLFAPKWHLVCNYQIAINMIWGGLWPAIWCQQPLGGFTPNSWGFTLGQETRRRQNLNLSGSSNAFLYAWTLNRCAQLDARSGNKNVLMLRWCVTVIWKAPMSNNQFYIGFLLSPSPGIRFSMQFRSLLPWLEEKLLSEYLILFLLYIL